MSTTYKSLGQANPAATTNTTLYTASAPALSSTLTAVNTGTTAAKIRVAKRVSGASLATQHYLVYDYPLQPAGSGDNGAFYTLGITLAATDVVTVYADTANVAFNLDGAENP